MTPEIVNMSAASVAPIELELCIVNLPDQVTVSFIPSPGVLTTPFPVPVPLINNCSGAKVVFPES